MKPKTKNKNFQLSLIKVPLSSLVKKDHELVKLSEVIDWQSLEETFGKFYEEKGRPAMSARLMISLHYLKFINELSDRELLSLWVENPYWQFFSGMEFFEHELPIDSSTMTRWRKRVKKEGAEKLLEETIKAGLKLRVVKPAEIKNVNADTTVQEKNIRFPTDSRLYHRAIIRLVAMAKKSQIILRQTYTRTIKRLLRNQQKFANSRKFAKAKSCTKKLKTLLGRTIRDVERKIITPSNEMDNLLKICKKIYTQERSDTNKIYSIHEPETSCIAKGKVHKKYEFGSKVSIISTNKSNFILGAISFVGNPHDSKTLSPALEQVLGFDLEIENVFVDKGYRGHGIKNKKVHICSYDKKKLGQHFWKKIKRRAAIEPIIGHLKEEHCLGRNRLSGTVGDAVNVLLSSAAFNLKKIMKWLKSQFLYFFTLIVFMLTQSNEKSVLA